MITLGRHSYMGNVHERFNPTVEVGNFTSIASDVYFYGEGCEHPWVMNRLAVSNFPFWEKQWGEYTHCGSRGKITIGSDVWIGEHAKLLDGARISDGAIIGAGAVVAGYVAPYSVVIGNPAVHKRFRFQSHQIEKLLKIKWWDLPDGEVKAILPLMENINKFLESFK